MGENLIPEVEISVSPERDVHREESTIVEKPTVSIATVDLSSSEENIETKPKDYVDPCGDKVIQLPVEVIKEIQSASEKPREKRYAEAYLKYQLGNEGSLEGSFILTPGVRKAIVGELPNLVNKLKGSFKKEEDGGTTELWNRGISAILAKALIAESIKYSVYFAKEIAKMEGDLLGCESGSGAGITAANIFLETKKANPNRKVQIHAVDIAVESILASALLFESQNIPYMILKDPEDIKSIDPSFVGIVLVNSDSIAFVEKSDRKYDFHVSENGISYFEKNKHRIALQGMLEKLKEGKPLYIAALNPQLVVDLDKKHLMKEIFGNGSREKYQRMKENGINPYVLDENRIVVAQTEEAGGQIELLRHLLYHDLATFVSYMGALGEASKAAVTLIEEIHSPISVTEEILGEGFPNDAKEWNTIGAPCEVCIIRKKN